MGDVVALLRGSRRGDRFSGLFKWLRHGLLMNKAAEDRLFNGESMRAVHNRGRLRGPLTALSRGSMYENGMRQAKELFGICQAVDALDHLGGSLPIPDVATYHWVCCLHIERSKSYFK